MIPSGFVVHSILTLCIISGVGNFGSEMAMAAEADQRHLGFAIKRTRVAPAVTLTTGASPFRVGDLLERQRVLNGAPAWDWEQTCAIHQKKVWNALELALLADFPSKIQVCFIFKGKSPTRENWQFLRVNTSEASTVQAVLRSVISDVFTIPSNIGVMPVIAVLASKYPKIAAMLIPDAPMHTISCFYLPNLTEQDLDPLMATTHIEMTPRDTKVKSSHAACITLS